MSINGASNAKMRREIEEAYESAAICKASENKLSGSLKQGEEEKALGRSYKDPEVGDLKILLTSNIEGIFDRTGGVTNIWPLEKKGYKAQIENSLNGKGLIVTFPLGGGEGKIGIELYDIQGVGVGSWHLTYSKLCTEKKTLERLGLEQYIKDGTVSNTLLQLPSKQSES